MKKKQVYLRLNLMSLFLITVSFISVTLAWFAYSGRATVGAEIDVKAWFIELENNGEKVSNQVTISLSNIYPGMETMDEVYKIKNLGDSDAELKYSIISARILDDDDNNYIVGEDPTSEYVEDLLSHEFPFSININLSKNYVLSKGEESYFNISISWPLDSGADLIDSQWGNKAYNFQVNEASKKELDSNYQIRPSIQVAITLTAEQFLENSQSSDVRYNLGDELLIDVINNSRCESISPTCIKMYVIDSNNTFGDNRINLLPNPYGSYELGNYNEYQDLFNNITETWNVTTRSLSVEDLIKIISRDVTSSTLIRENISDKLIGNLNYSNRINTELAKAISGDGAYKFLNEKFPYLVSADCYWMETNYNDDKAFALKKSTDIHTEIFGKLKSDTCKVIPVVSIEKINL
ncbi:MAG: hypothetical protein PHG03_03785 [Bacilli bacterium]|nr:hypothetical protein [Bacilli bacterium]